ncbi:MAG TPA: exodeoxyribonuclease VII small subunit [Thermoguttaceae bacterium]|nr:exodeoxyribonuclease VII small subunit [Thermoguttaceae bacterium]
MTKKKNGDESAPGFEQCLAELEKTVHDLEEGQIGLEESLARYENGVKLLRHCYDQLTNAQRRIELLDRIDAEGRAVTRPIEEEPSDTLEEKAQRRSRRRTAPGGAGEPRGTTRMGDAGDTDGPDDVDEPGGLF